MQEYLSKTEKIQAYIKEVLDDEQKHSMKDIISYVDSKLKENGEFVFQINSYVNAAMRLLMKNEDYTKVSHGVYQKGGIPYTPASKKADHESGFEKMDIRSAMVAVKAYANSFEKLYAQKPPFSDMEVNEEAAYWAIKKHSLDVANPDICLETSQLTRNACLAVYSTFASQNVAISKHISICVIV